MKKISAFLLLLFGMFSLVAFHVNTEGHIVYETGGAKYFVEEVKEVNQLAFNVVHTREIGQTSTLVSDIDADGIGSGKELVVPGQYYPQQVNFLEVPSSKDVKIATWANLNNHRWTLTTVKNLIGDYEIHHPGWKVIAAINGDFFDINAYNNFPYQTSGAVVADGEHYKTSTGPIVGFRNDGSTNPLVGNKVVKRTDKMILAIYNDQGEIINEFLIDQINVAPGENETSIFYANYDSDHKIVPIEVNPGGSSGYFVDEAEYALPNNPNDFYGKGVISSTNAKTIEEGQFAIVTNNEDLKSALAIGTKIRCQFELVGDYAGIKEVVGYNYPVLIDGEDNPNGDLNYRGPRTVVGRKADGTIVMMVVDGRQASDNMYGAERTEIAAIMKSRGCVEAYNLDGGGSSTMIIRRDGEFVVLNSPSDGRERADSNCVLVVARDPEIEITTTNIEKNSLSLNVNLINNNGYDIQELFVEVNGETKPVINNQVDFANLTNNTRYTYLIYFKDSFGDIKQLVQQGKTLPTLKEIPIFNGFEIIETPKTFEVTMLYEDPDLASNLYAAKLGMNGKKTYIRDGFASLDKSIWGDTITQISLEYNYDINDGKRQYITLDNPNYTIINEPDLEIKTILQQENALTLSVNLINKNDYDVQELFIELNGERKAVVNGQVEFTSLSSNTEYSYNIYYKDTAGDLKKLVQSGNTLPTLKTTPSFVGFEIKETATTFEIKMVNEDEDSAIKADSIELEFNDKKLMINKGKTTLKKSEYGNELFQIALSYQYDLNDGNPQTVSIDNPDYLIEVIVESYLNYFILVQDQMVKDIYK